MAHIDNLIQKIADPTLREQMAQEVASLLNHTNFGLVFQRHLPEDIEIPNLRPRRGDIVKLRADASRNSLVVMRTDGDRASVAPLEPSGQIADGTLSFDCDVDDLVVVKDFRQPIYPGLKLLSESRRGGEKPAHIVLDSENYHALEMLLYTHEKSIDLIYIDPPYNTGSDEWIYNDRFVVSADAYKHSKWLSFMERRLVHAKRLLKDSGVIVVAIGDDEHHRLRLLLDQIFGDQNFLANVIWQGGVSALAKHTGGGVDYMLVYARDRESHITKIGQWRDPKDGTQEVLEAGTKFWMESGEDPRVATELLKKWWSQNKKRFETGVSVYNKIDDTGRIYFAGDLANGAPRPNLRYDIIHPTTGKPVKRPSNGWRHERSKMQDARKY